MKAMFKPLGIVAAVAAASAAISGQVNASTIDAGNLGDLALIPYYTTQAGFATGVHITNTSNYTQVVKLRLRRGSDSMDALDFNLVLSPYDVWAGTVTKDGDDIIFRTGDNSCTAPAPNHPDGFKMPNPTDGTTSIDFREGADEGYIEVIGMAQADASQPISKAALHDSAGMPKDCGLVRSNFFRNSVLTVGDGDMAAKGVISSLLTHQTAGGSVVANNYMDTENVLSVSYFVRDTNSGLEMGSRAVHVADFSADAMMSHQQTFVEGTADLWGYFYPDLDGGSPGDTARALFDGSVRPILGVGAIMNDWSVNANLNVSTDWVVTLPGQYLMVHRNRYAAFVNEIGGTTCPKNVCDFRDIPVTAEIRLWNREEGTIIPSEDGLVVSPSVGEEDPAILLPYEVNVIRWTGPETDGDEGVLSSMYDGFIDVGDLGASGWAALAIKATATKTQSVCPQEVLSDVAITCVPVANVSVPMIGFVAWERTFEEAANNYGRIIDHSWTATS